MLTLQRGTVRSTDRPRRSRGAFAASVAVNAVLITVFVHALVDGRRWSDLFRPSTPSQVAERITFVQAPRSEGAPTKGRSGGDGRPVSRTPARPMPQAPSTVPDRIAPPPPTNAPPAVEAGGSGAVVGKGGAAVGIEPNYTDSRLWARPGQGAGTAAHTAKERIDSVIADAFAGVRDSMIAEKEALAGQRKPGDWTVKGPGGKWGMDQSSIHLGKVSIPNAILALLSESFQNNIRGNPIQMSEDRRLAAVRADLLQHAQTEMNEDAFRSAVKQIRARKDRERAARTAVQGGTTADVPSSAQPNRQ